MPLRPHFLCLASRSLFRRPTWPTLPALPARGFVSRPQRHLPPLVAAGLAVGKHDKPLCCSPPLPLHVSSSSTSLAAIEFDANMNPTFSRQSSTSSPLRTSPNGIGNAMQTENFKKPFLIGVGGGTASGKSTVCQRIIEEVNKSNGTSKQIISLSQDSFYRDLTEEEAEQAKEGMFNFDHPGAFDHELMVKCLNDIQNGRPTEVPVYDFTTNARIKNEVTKIEPSDVVLIEGILIFYHKDVRDIFDMKLFVDTDADTRLSRRVLRDINDRGRDLKHVLLQYNTLVKPAFEEFCLPTKKHADVIIPRGADNTVALQLIIQHIRDKLSRQSQQVNPVSQAAAAASIRSRHVSDTTGSHNRPH